MKIRVGLGRAPPNRQMASRRVTSRHVASRRVTSRRGTSRYIESRRVAARRGAAQRGAAARRRGAAARWRGAARRGAARRGPEHDIRRTKTMQTPQIACSSGDAVWQAVYDLRVSALGHRSPRVGSDFERRRGVVRIHETMGPKFPNPKQENGRTAQLPKSPSSRIGSDLEVELLRNCLESEQSDLQSV